MDLARTAAHDGYLILRERSLGVARMTVDDGADDPVVTLHAAARPPGAFALTAPIGDLVRWLAAADAASGPPPVAGP